MGNSKVDLDFLYRKSNLIFKPSKGVGLQNKKQKYLSGVLLWFFQGCFIEISTLSPRRQSWGNSIFFKSSECLKVVFSGGFIKTLDLNPEVR